MTDSRHGDEVPGMAQGVANRDIKLENTLLDDSERPLLKICDFGYSKVCHKAWNVPGSNIHALCPLRWFWQGLYAFACML